MRLQDSIPTSPAEPDCPDLVRTWYLAHRVHESVNQRSRDCLAMLDQPWPKCRRYNGRVLRLISQGESLLFLERRLDVLQELDRQRVAFVEVGEVAIKPILGILIGKESCTTWFPSQYSVLKLGDGGTKHIPRAIARWKCP